MTEYTQRVLPTLRALFANKAVRNHPAPEVFAAAIKDMPNPHIDVALRNNRGDVLFTATQKWYLMQNGTKQAHALAAPVQYWTNGQDKFETQFADELRGDAMATLRVDLQNNICAIQGITGRQHGFEQKVLMRLFPLAEDEMAQLRAAVIGRKITFVAEVETRGVECAFEDNKGNVFVVSCVKNNYRYETLRLFTGTSLDDLREIALTNVDRFRDGGTTYYRTAEGTLFNPSPMRDGDPKWAAGHAPSNLGGEDCTVPALTALDAAEVEAKLASDSRIVGMTRWQGDANAPAIKAPKY